MGKGPPKGVSNNPAGKPKGTLNKTTKQMKEMLNSIMDKQWDKVEASLEKLYEEDPVKYVDIITKYFPYVIPKKVDVTSDEKPINQIKVTVSKEGDKGEIEKLDKDD